MLTAALLSATLFNPMVGAQAANPEVLVNRKFKVGEVNSYRVSSLLTVEIREEGLETFLPSDTGYEYNFSTSVSKVDEDGNATMRYDRGPTIRIEGEYGDRPAQRIAEDKGFKFDLVVTPINEFIDMKQVKEPAKPTPPKNRFLRILQDGEGQMSGTALTDALVGQYISDLYRIALMLGSLDSAFDFSPKLPEDPIKKGDTWMSTISYQPQRLSGTNRQAVQRVDMKFTYGGRIMVNNKPFERISASLVLDNDMVGFVNQTYGIPANQSPFKSLRLKFNTNVVWDLDPETFKTVRGRATSTGSVTLEMRGEDRAFAERKITGESNFQLVGTRVAPAQTPPRRPGRSR